MNEKPGEIALLPYREAVATFQIEYMLTALASARWNISRAAKLSGLHRTYFHRLMLEHGITFPPGTPRARGGRPRTAR